MCCLCVSASGAEGHPSSPEEEGGARLQADEQHPGGALQQDPGSHVRLPQGHHPRGGLGGCQGEPPLPSDSCFLIPGVEFYTVKP